MLRVSHVAEAAEQLLHQEQGNLLQDGLLQVGCGPWASSAAAVRPRVHTQATFTALSDWSLVLESALLEHGTHPDPVALSIMNPRLQITMPGDLPPVPTAHWVWVVSLTPSWVLLESQVPFLTSTSAVEF